MKPTPFIEGSLTPFKMFLLRTNQGVLRMWGTLPQMGRLLPTSVKSQSSVMSEFLRLLSLALFWFKAFLLEQWNCLKIAGSVNLSRNPK